ncbi:hypothetical protein KY285_016184 [Solanum tuberosum]|nr:hypothetical protein KY285_016184 [Solanum tuberosum]
MEILKEKKFSVHVQNVINHGEWDVNLNVDDDMDYSRDDIDGLLNDQFRDVAQAEGAYDGPNEDAKKFYNLVEEASQELYPGCTGFSKLSFTLRLYLLKCLHGWSNESFTSLLELLKEAMPELNIPPSYNKTKSMVKNLGLDYEKIDACPNWIACCSGMIIRMMNFVILVELHDILNLLKLITADSLRWHDEERSKDGKLRHPADGPAGKYFDRLHPDFVLDCRNVRLGLSSDGFNPFRTMSISHSTWPVMLMVYNLLPWMCMKSEYSILSLLIPGPRSTGNDIDIYLQPLIDELKLLWNSGVETYDASRNQTFQMRAALMWTINDFPAYAMLSGWSTKGKFACPCCNYGTNSRYLKHSRKMCYMDHHIFLPMDHPWRSNKRSFKGKTEFRPPPPFLKGTDVLNSLQDFENVFGKKRKRSNDGPWKKKSIFFELPYWQHNLLRHNLDVMHIEKNIVDSILGTLLDISGKTKDHAKARYDLKDMGIRKNLHPKDTEDRPNSVAKRYSGYLINGYRFHVRQRDTSRKTQNSGVTLVASTTSFASSKDKNPIAADLTYYGRIVDIVELDNYGHFKVVLFKCDWYVVENDTYGLTYVYFNKRCSQEESFVLGSQVHQCFYVQDLYDQDKHYVMKTVPRDLFNMGDQVESNLPQSYENEPSEYLMGPSIPKDNGEVLLTRTDVPETIIDVPSEEFVTQQLEVEEEEFEDECADEFEDESENEYEDESENEYEDEFEDELEDESEEEFEYDTP